MNCIKDVLEMAYYIAFIILTWRITVYAKETFILQAKKHHRILCKVCTMDGKRGYMTEYGLELYNFGNDLASNIEVSVLGKVFFKCDFIKPNESIVFPIGEIIHTAGGNRVAFGNGMGELYRDSPFTVELKLDGKQESFDVSTDMLFSYTGSETSEIVKSIEHVASAIKNKK